MEPPEELDRLRALDTCSVSDALDRCGIAGAALGIASVVGRHRIVGRAVTVQLVPVGPDAPTGRHLGTAAVESSGPDDVIVVDNGGRLDATVWGDLLTPTAIRNGVAGTVIDGVCRDLDRTLSERYPIFARGNWMRTGKDRVRVESTGKPVSIGGIRVEAGDWLVGDSDGLVAIPARRATEVVEAAEDIRDAEELIRQAVLAGSSLRAARHDHGYHTLQTPR